MGVTDTPSPTKTDALANLNTFERRADTVLRAIPYVLLALGTLLSQLSKQSTSDRLVTAGLAVTAAAWTWSILPPVVIPATTQWRIRVYFMGFLVFAALLMQRDIWFFTYLVSGFFLAFLLRPWALAFAAIGATSLLVNSGIIADDPDTGAWTFYGIVVVIQTVGIGFGVMGGEKLAELSEERWRMVAELEAAIEENAGLHAQLVTQAREAGAYDERQRMAREIHDTLAQGLTGVITQLEAVRQARGHPMEAERHLDSAIGLARESLAEARRSVQALAPVPLTESRLPEALSDVARRWSERTGIPATVSTTGDLRLLHLDVEVTLLRAAQEALANVERHSSATRTGVTLSFIDDRVSLDVRDDGIGFSINGNREGFGLKAMRQRVQQLHGTVEVESRPGEGTAISVNIPDAPSGLET